MKSYYISIALVVSLLCGLVTYLYYSPPSKGEGELVSFDTVINTPEVKRYLERIILDKKTSSIAYERASVILGRAKEQDVSIGYIRDVSNFIHVLLGKKRYWCNVKIGKGVEIDMVITLNKNKDSDVLAFYLTTF